MTVRLLAKFGKREHLEKLQKNGSFYCKDIKFFIEIEDGKVRGDEFEAALELKFFESLKISIKPIDKPDEEWKSFIGKNNLYKIHTRNPLGNLFCMSAFETAVSQEPSKFLIDPRFKSFGDHYLLITNQKAFFEKLFIKLDELGFEYATGLVDYIELKKYTGKKDMYQKDLEYSWQEEFRIFFDSGLMEPLEFSIGSLEDISILCKLSEAPSFLLRQ